MRLLPHYEPDSARKQAFRGLLRPRADSGPRNDRVDKFGEGVKSLAWQNRKGIKHGTHPRPRLRRGRGGQGHGLNRAHRARCPCHPQQYSDFFTAAPIALLRLGSVLNLVLTRPWWVSHAAGIRTRREETRDNG